MIKKLTFTIYFEHGYGHESFADAVGTALPTRLDLIKLLEHTVPAIKPITFKLESELKAYVTFDDEVEPGEPPPK